MVVSDLFGMSGREMMAALVAGERNPKVLAQLARRRMRAKIGVLEEAFTGHFTEHHAFLLGRMLARVDAISADIADLDTRSQAGIHRNCGGWFRNRTAGTQAGQPGVAR